MSPVVTWTTAAKDAVNSPLKETLDRELERLFESAESVSVHDYYEGYQKNPDQKVILGVEVQDRESACSFVVKLGLRDRLEPDYKGWQSCLKGKSFANRIFVNLRLNNQLPNDRIAVIYENAFALFGPVAGKESPQCLEQVAEWAVMDDRPSPDSVERVLRQIYTELANWFYCDSEVDVPRAIARYHNRLEAAIPKWKQDSERILMRRDMIWLASLHSDDHASAVYRDPVDYLEWALHNETVPPTLIGRSHGDLHGRNILVGVRRGEAEFPTVIDYGDMSPTNVIVWDFVKLETELKVRILGHILSDESSRSGLLALTGNASNWKRMSKLDATNTTDSHGMERLRLMQLDLAYAFEAELSRLTELVLAYNSYKEPVYGGLQMPSGSSDGDTVSGPGRTDGKVARLLAIIMRIRQEAAYLLGLKHTRRSNYLDWRDEYLFALAVYGVYTARFNYQHFESAHALVSAGVAVGGLDAATRMFREPLKVACDPTVCRCGADENSVFCPGHEIPLAHAHRHWVQARAKDRPDSAIRILECAAIRYPHATPLSHERALALLDAGRPRDALSLLLPLERQSRLVGDQEMLCRMGRACKDIADRSLEKDPCGPTAIQNHDSHAWYRAALAHYQAAYDVRGDYYPGVNLAFLTFVVGDPLDARQIARNVFAACQVLEPQTVRPEETIWLKASQADACIMLERPREAAQIYRQVIDLGAESMAGPVQTVYNQFCRLAWLFGARRCQSSLKVFRKRAAWLEPGPLGNGCSPGHRRTKR